MTSRKLCDLRDSLIRFMFLGWRIQFHYMDLSLLVPEAVEPIAKPMAV